MARCGCGGECGCNLIAGTNTTVTGSGSAANPWVVNSSVPCTAVRPCLSGTAGVNYNPATGVISADISGTAGNSLVLDGDGLFVSPGNNAVVVGCGIQGNGTAGNPLTVNTLTWPFACTPEANGTVVTCDANGDLRGAPGYPNYYDQTLFNRFYPNTVVPAPQNTPVDSFSFTYTNPDPCRSVRVLLERELDIDIDLPPGAGASFGYDNDEMGYVRNTGTTTIIGSHTQVTKVFEDTILAPGASTTNTSQATMGRGTGGATFTRIQTFFRVFMFTL